MVMHEMLKKTGAARVVVLRLENGGGKPALGKTLKSSVVYEVYSPSEESISETWQNQQVDDEYIKLIVDVSTRKVSKVETDKLEESILKSSYLARGIRFSFKFEIYEAKTSYFYLSFYFKDVPPVSPAVSDAMRYGVNEIRSIYKEQYRYA